MKFDSKNVHPWMKKHRLIARIYCIFAMIVLPFLFVVDCVRERLPDLKEEMSLLFRAVFGKWE